MITLTVRDVVDDLLLFRFNSQLLEAVELELAREGIYLDLHVDTDDEDREVLSAEFGDKIVTATLRVILFHPHFNKTKTITDECTGRYTRSVDEVRIDCGVTVYMDTYYRALVELVRSLGFRIITADGSFSRDVN